MPHVVHNRFDDPLGFAIGSRCPNPGQALLDTIRQARLHKGVMFGVSPILFAIVTVELFNRIEAFLQYLLQKSL